MATNVGLLHCGRPVLQPRGSILLASFHEMSMAVTGQSYDFSVILILISHLMQVV